MLRTQRADIARMTSTVKERRTQVFPAQLSSPAASRPKRVPTSASEPTTITPVMATAQPPSQPVVGPRILDTQEKVVPQSGSTRLR